MRQVWTITLIFLVFIAIGCSGGWLTTREKGAGNGALGGAAVGGIIGAAVGHPGAGAAIGSALGLGSGLLIGDQLQGQEQRQADQQQQINSNQAGLNRQRRDRKTQAAGRILGLKNLPISAGRNRTSKRKNVWIAGSTAKDKEIASSLGGTNLWIRS